MVLPENLNSCYIVTLLYSGFIILRELVLCASLYGTFSDCHPFLILDSSLSSTGNAILCQEEVESKFRSESSMSAFRFPVLE